MFHSAKMNAFATVIFALFAWVAIAVYGPPPVAAATACPGGFQPVQSLNGRTSAGVLVVNACQSLTAGNIIFQTVAVDPPGTTSGPGSPRKWIDFGANGSQTLEASQAVGSFILAAPGADVNYQLPTATAIVNLVTGCETDLTFITTIRNQNSGHTITLTTNTGITLVTGTDTIATNHQREFYIRITSCTSPAVSVYSGVDSAF